jgi:hypothetical protein
MIMLKTVHNLIAAACVAVLAAGCNPIEPVPIAVAKAAEPVLPLHPDPAPGSGDGAVYEYH